MVYTDGAIIAKPTLRCGVSLLWSYRVIGCRCGEQSTIVDHTTMDEAQQCSQRLLNMNKTEEPNAQQPD